MQKGSCLDVVTAILVLVQKGSKVNWVFILPASSKKAAMSLPDFTKMKGSSCAVRVLPVHQIEFRI